MRSWIDWCKANEVWDVKELPFLPTKQGVCDIVWPCHFTLKSILRQKKNYRNPSRYITSRYIFLEKP